MIHFPQDIVAYDTWVFGFYMIDQDIGRVYSDGGISLPEEICMLLGKPDLDKQEIDK